MLLVTVLWAVVLALLVVVVRGPERWHRSVVLNLRPDAAEPTRSGYALLFWRHAALLVLAVSLAHAATAERLGPGEEEVVERVGTAVDLVPAEELGVRRVAAELAVLAGPGLVVEERATVPAASSEPGSTDTTVLAQVLRLPLTDRLGLRDADPDEGDEVACLALTTFDLGSEPATTASVTPGACEDH